MNELIEADVVVVGAGPSGIPAAIAAARAGRRVVLVEEDAVPGGCPVDSFVTFLCGGPRVGLYREMAERLNAAHDLTGAPIPDFNVGVTGREHWYMPAAYLDVLYAMIEAEPNLRLICGAPVTGVRVREDGNRRRVEGVTIDRPAQPTLEIRAAVTIDATGTGLVAALAGCETRYGRDARADFNEPHAPVEADTKAMPCTWMYMSERVRSDARVPAMKELSPHGFVESNVGWCGHDEAAYHRRNTGLYLHWGSTVFCPDTRNSVALAAAQREAFDRIRADMKVFAAHGFVLHPAPRIGVRESRRVMGETVVTEHDLVEGRVPEDAVAWAHYFLDLWGEDLIKKHVGIRAALPYRAMIPKGAEGLLVTGKAISGTHVALSAYRVQPIVAALGQAAGEAAAMAAGSKTGVRDIEMGVLQARLRQTGVLPEA
jgi:hypothetical protein